MRQDNKILISAVLILGVALVAFNFGGVSGKAAKFGCQDITVTVTDSSLSNIDLMVHIPSERGTNYNGIGDDQVIIRNDAGYKKADVRIPKSLKNANSGDTVKFRVSKLSSVPSGWACIESKCSGEEVCDRFP